jgi:hypothetical protein
MMIDSQKILEKIKEEKIKPTPKWHFLLKNYFIWAAFAISVLIGSLSFSVILYILTDSNWDIYKYLDKNFAEYLLLSLPYFWILFIIGFILLSYYNYKHTKKGYKYASYLVIILSVVISFVFGGTLFAFGLGEKIDQALSNNIPYYQQKIIENKIERWHHPEKGLLIGTVEEAISDEEVIVKDFENKEWLVKLEEKIPKEIMEQRINKEIRMIGEKENEGKFNAKNLRGCKRGCEIQMQLRKEMMGEIKEKMEEKRRNIMEHKEDEDKDEHDDNKKEDHDNDKEDGDENKE